MFQLFRSLMRQLISIRSRSPGCGSTATTLPVGPMMRAPLPLETPSFGTHVDEHVAFGQVGRDQFRGVRLVDAVSDDPPAHVGERVEVEAYAHVGGQDGPPVGGG